MGRADPGPCHCRSNTSFPEKGRVIVGDPGMPSTFGCDSFFQGRSKNGWPRSVANGGRPFSEISLTPDFQLGERRARFLQPFQRFLARFHWNKNKPLETVG